MIHIWLYAGRAAVVSSYLTLGLADRDLAGCLAAPFGGLVLAVVAWDWWTDR